MSSFVRDTKLINDRININDHQGVINGNLEVVFLPYYVDPETLKLTVVLKRSIMNGSYAMNGTKMGLSALTVSLPKDNPITLEDAYAQLGLNTTIQNAIPFGAVMSNPFNSTETYEMVVVQVEPIQLLDTKKGIVSQMKGEYEVGIVPFDDILEAIQSNFIQDLKTRMILSELYIMALEEANNTTSNESVIGGGANLPSGFGSQENTIKTTDIPDEIILENSQKDYGAIYSKIKKSADFKSIK